MLGIQNLINLQEVLREINYIVIYVFCLKERPSKKYKTFLLLKM